MQQSDSLYTRSHTDTVRTGWQVKRWTGGHVDKWIIVLNNEQINLNPNLDVGKNNPKLNVLFKKLCTNGHRLLVFWFIILMLYIHIYISMLPYNIIYVVEHSRVEYSFSHIYKCLAHW